MRPPTRPSKPADVPRPLDDPFPDMPTSRPAGLATRRARHRNWWRFDADDPRTWTWKPFPVALHRFDPHSATFRVRYAASSLPSAVAERFGSHGLRRATAADAHTVVALLVGRPESIDLTHASTRTLLRIDERISTGRASGDRRARPDPFLNACGRLADRIDSWFGIPTTAVLFRSRRDAEHVNAAFSSGTLDVADTHPPEPLSSSRPGITALLASGVSVPTDWIDQLDD